MAAGGWSGGTLAAREAPWPAVAVAAEAAAEEVVRRLRPTEASERRRAEVVAYARRLIGAALGCEVFVYGSVPLKTYLPDGDIDLTILGNTSHNNTLVNDVYCVLDSEEQNVDAEFEVKDLDRINAEVRLIKCTIDNIIVDISFNQTGGICALCFLELVDRKVGKNHLFKRSIILIKAWCYYESRLLGAHHGLISTYALEVLILYIFNLFHKSLHGPLEVLYRFLEYFSKFDWDNYCISLNGPVALSALPNLTVEVTGIHTDDLLFDKEFLKRSVDEVFVPRRDSGQSAACYTRFRPKHLNIIDPLKEYNNLGRSVNRASFHRIRTAFSYGARKLHQILMLQSELIPKEIYGFFKNTLERNGRGFRPDVASTGAFHPSFGTGNILEQISSMSISYRKGDQNGSHPDHSNGLGDTGSYSTKGYPLLYQESGNGSSEKCDVGCYVDHVTEHLCQCTAKTLDSDDRSLIQSRAHVNDQLPTLNSYANVNNLITDKKSWRAIQAEKQQPPALSLRLPDLLGDLDLQFRCLRQVQYHLEYLFDAFLQSVQAASSDNKFQKAPFHIPTLSILLDADAALAGLLLPSSTESNGMELSPVSCSHSTKAISKHSQDEDSWDVASQQNISLHSGIDSPSNELSPSSSCNDSDSSVSWCYSSEGSPEMHGTGAFFPRKSYDTYKQQLAHSKENGKILTNCPVLIETNQSSYPGRSFVPQEEQVASPGRIKEATIGQPVKVQGLNKKNVEKHSGHPRKEFAMHEDKTWQMPKYDKDFCLNANILRNQQYGTDMEFARASIAIRQAPKYQTFNSIQSTAKDCTSGRLSKYLPRKQSYGTSKKNEILDWQNQQYGTVCSKKHSAGKEHLSFVTGTGHVSCNSVVSVLNGMENGANAKKFDEKGNKLWPLLQEVPLSLHSINIQQRPPISDTSMPSSPVTNVPPLETIEFGSLGPFALASLKSNKVTNTHSDHKVLTDASALVVQRSRTSARPSRSSESCKVVNEDEFPPLNAVVR